MKSKAEQPPKTVNEIASTIALATGINDLCEKIEQDNITLPGSKMSYSPSDLVNTIRLVQQGKEDVNIITRTAGLRSKVIELLGDKSNPEPEPEAVTDFKKMHSYSYLAGMKYLEETVDDIRAIDDEFEPNSIEIINRIIVSGRMVCEIQLPNLPKPILLYQSTGLSKSELNKEGKWFIFAGWLNEYETDSGMDYNPGWFIKTERSADITRWQEAEKENRKLTYIEELAKFFENNPPNQH